MGSITTAMMIGAGPTEGSRDREDASRSPGRGLGESKQSEATGDAREDARWGERDRGERDRVFDPRAALTRDLNLPRGRDRELVHYRDRDYTLRGSESRTLAAVGAFRVVSSRGNDRSYDLRSSDLRHLREQKLVDVVRVPGQREHAVTLTRDGRGLLESHRDRDREHGQAFYNGVKRERELAHDVQVYRACEREAARLQDARTTIERVVLDYELKSEYQTWLHEHDRDRADYDGHPDRDEAEIREWALDHDLPYFDDQVRGG